ncbi:MAG: D-alanyl-D-alanine carboxypeptidase family protein [Clostridia bacterium]|nr:D-alanyl-D-alanine carboxypeptidase family protein [Clostridia bacterium]
MFAYHKILENRDGIVIELYLDLQWTEFALEFDKNPKENIKRLEDAVWQYIVDRLPEVKAKTVRIMLGSILIASLTVNHAYAAGINPAAEKAWANYSPPSVYSVQSGDSLFKIAEKAGVSIERLKSVNGFLGDTVYAGQQFIIPGRNNEVYVVQPGDTLYLISHRLGTTVEQIKTSNGLKSDVISAGQWLRVSVQRKKAYTVRYGDTLYNIAGRYKVSFELLKAVNGLKSNAVNTGQVLLIPISGAKFIASRPDSLMVLVNKSYSLTSSYEPQDMVVPDVDFTSGEYSPKKLMRQEAAIALEHLFLQAKQHGIDLYALSGYRSYQRQEEIFSNNIKKYGSPESANRFSAKPGESEHQTGLAMDITAPSVYYSISQSFGDTAEGRWLKQNAPDFGFIIRYPEGKEEVTGYQYEPWHVRYVGIETAKAISMQRITLEEYLGKY